MCTGEHSCIKPFNNLHMHTIKLSSEKPLRIVIFMIFDPVANVVLCFNIIQLNANILVNVAFFIVYIFKQQKFVICHSIKST